MSESLQRFAEALSESPELREKIQTLHAESAKSVAERLAKLSGEYGLAFTAEEFLMASNPGVKNELTDSDLQAVAGGTWEPTAVNIGVSLLSFGILCAGLASVSAARGSVDSCQASRG